MTVSSPIPCRQDELELILHVKADSVSKQVRHKDPYQDQISSIDIRESK